MELSTEHLDLLQAIADLETPTTHPGTKAAGRRLVEIWQERGGGHAWQAYPPWNGTSPWAQQLHEAGLIDAGPGIAKFRRPDQPAETMNQYWLSLTDAGREVLAAGE